jgi:peptidoglycan LD-endopeptidase LytH
LIAYLKKYKILLIVLTGYLIPQQVAIPVKGATSRDWHPKSFWYYPWGKSVTHKGVDIFAREGTPVISATPGIVIYAGTLGRGGNVALVLSSKWRIHYYAHLGTALRRYAFRLTDVYSRPYALVLLIISLFVL